MIASDEGVSPAIQARLAALKAEIDMHLAIVKIALTIARAREGLDLPSAGPGAHH